MAKTEEILQSQGALIQDTSTFSSKVKKTLKHLWNKETDFSEASIPSALQSHLKSKYGTFKETDKRLEEFMNSIASWIDTKVVDHQYSISMEIPEDLVDYKELIVNYLKSKGYIASEISANIPLEEFKNLKRTYIFVAFDNFDYAKNAKSVWQKEGGETPPHEENSSIG